VQDIVDQCDLRVYRPEENICVEVRCTPLRPTLVTPWSSFVFTYSPHLVRGFVRLAGWSKL
jgi:hypothetical protein